jgi:hypothetical protein
VDDDLRLGDKSACLVGGMPVDRTVYGRLRAYKRTTDPQHGHQKKRLAIDSPHKSKHEMVS